LTSEQYDAVLIGVNYTRDTTSVQEGIDLLSETVAQESMLPVIAMTAWGNVELPVEAMWGRARDFIQEPWENEHLLSILRTQIELHRALQQAERALRGKSPAQCSGQTGIRRHSILDDPDPRSHEPALCLLTQTCSLQENMGAGRKLWRVRSTHFPSVAAGPLALANTGGLAEVLRASYSDM
jgi:DNA-binding NarL/FixJ family response regulator